MEFWLFIIFIVFTGLLKLFVPTIKGKLGEAEVARRLSCLPKNEYRLINNVLLKTNRGSVQIDHIVVSIYGIFVIETKNYKGWIYGSENSDNWIQYLYKKEYSFHNPISQNYSHILALKKILRMDEYKFISIVVFLSNSKLNIHTLTPVVYISELNNTIKNYTKQKLHISKLDKIVTKINSLNIDSKDNRKSHIKSVKNNICTMNSTIHSGKCPKCGGKLVEQKSKYGVFLGCSNYPKCKFTKSLK